MSGLLTSRLAPCKACNIELGLQGKAKQASREACFPLTLSAFLLSCVLRRIRAGRKTEEVKNKKDRELSWLEPMERDHNSDYEGSQNNLIPAPRSGFEQRAGHHYTTSMS